MTKDTVAAGWSVGQYEDGLRPSSGLEGTHEKALQPIASLRRPGADDGARPVRRAIRLHRSRVGLRLIRVTGHRHAAWAARAHRHLVLNAPEGCAGAEQSTTYALRDRARHSCGRPSRRPRSHDESFAVRELAVFDPAALPFDFEPDFEAEPGSESLTRTCACRQSSSADPVPAWPPSRRGSPAGSA